MWDRDSNFIRSVDLILYVALLGYFKKLVYTHDSSDTRNHLVGILPLAVKRPKQKTCPKSLSLNNRGVIIGAMHQVSRRLGTDVWGAATFHLETECNCGSECKKLKTDAFPERREGFQHIYSLHARCPSLFRYKSLKQLGGLDQCSWQISTRCIRQHSSRCTGEPQLLHRWRSPTTLSLGEL